LINISELNLSAPKYNNQHMLSYSDESIVDISPLYADKISIDLFENAADFSVEEKRLFSIEETLLALNKKINTTTDYHAGLESSLLAKIEWLKDKAQSVVSLL